MTLSLVYWLFFLGPLMVGFNRCILGQPHKTCCYGDALAQLSSHHNLALRSLHLPIFSAFNTSTSIMNYFAYSKIYLTPWRVPLSTFMLCLSSVYFCGETYLHICIARSRPNLWLSMPRDTHAVFQGAWKKHLNFLPVSQRSCEWLVGRKVCTVANLETMFSILASQLD